MAGLCLESGTDRLTQHSFVVVLQSIRRDDDTQKSTINLLHQLLLLFIAPRCISRVVGQYADTLVIVQGIDCRCSLEIFHGF